MIFYQSTRGEKKSYSFSEVILKGIATDGGLFVPVKTPKLSMSKLRFLIDQSYQERSFSIFNLFQTDLPADLLKKIIEKSYSRNFDHPDIAPLVKLKDKQY